MTRNDSREQLDRCWHWLEAALEYCGPTHTKADVWHAIESSAAQFWPLPNAAIVTTVDTHPTGFKVLHGWLSGGDLNEIVQFEPLIVKWAKEIGCNRVTLAGRKGWRRAMPGYTEMATILGKDI